jgi:multidrug efflux pump subunit AcrA (membrane-fusion protein)
MQRIRFPALIVLAGLALAACGKEPAQSSKATEPPVVRDVTVGVVISAMVDDTAEVVGTVKSRTSTTLSSKIVGTILVLHAREGSQVEAGQVLVELDDRDIAAQLRRAEAGLREAEASVGEVDRAIAAATAARAAAEAQRDLAAATLARYQRLLDRKSVAPQEYDQVAARHKAAAADVERAGAEVQALQAKRQQIFARIEAAKAEVSSARVMHGYARITAPFSGVVTTKHVDVGALAAPGTPLLTLEDSRRYWLEAAVPESQAALIRRGQSLPVSVEAAALSVIATVSEIVPAADPTTRTTLVRVDLPDSPRLRSGFFGRAWVPVGRRQAIQVTRQAVIERGQLQGVYVVGQDDIARFRLVRTGQARRDRVEILSGLTGGEKVVLAGVEKVTDGARIEGAKP